LREGLTMTKKKVHTRTTSKRIELENCGLKEKLESNSYKEISY